MKFTKSFCNSVQQIAGRLGEYANEPIPVAMSSETTELKRLRDSVLSEVNRLEQEFATELLRTRSYGWVKFVFLLVFVFAVLVGSITVLSSSENLYRVIGAASAAGGIFAAANWILAALDRSQSREIGLTFIIRRYRVMLLSCTTVACVQKLAREIADSFDSLVA